MMIQWQVGKVTVRKAYLNTVQTLGSTSFYVERKVQQYRVGNTISS